MLAPKIKRSILTGGYSVFDVVRRTYWKISGGRKETVFGEKFLFSPSTHYPAYRGLRLPKGGVLDASVRYGDYVQIHSAFLFLEELSHPPLVVDIGAHHGIYAVLLGKLVQRKKGKLIAVEPNPDAFRILQENVASNGLSDTVICEKSAIMERSGTVRLAVEDDQSHVVWADGPNSVNVAALSMQELLKKYSVGSVDLLMIDVEGAELNVLRSIEWRSTKVGRIFCELHPYNWKLYGYSGEELSLFLKEHNYRCVDMYLRELREFSGESYLGPTLFLSGQQ